jgi:hypothetical protein
VQFQSQNIESEETNGDFEFYYSDCNVEDGDDDLFLDNVDRGVNDYNERVVFEECEDEAALEDEDIILGEYEREKLKYKFKAFYLEIDMDNPVFNVGMAFSD